MVEFEPDAIRVFEQDRVIARRPSVLARRADNFGAERLKKTMQLIDVGALARAEAEMVKADTLLFEYSAFVLGRRRADADRGPAADAIIGRLGIDHGLQSEERQQFTIKFARAFKIRSGEEYMCDAVDFHGLPLRLTKVPGPLMIEHTAKGGTRCIGIRHVAAQFGSALPMYAALLALMTTDARASAADCTLKQQGEGRVAAVVDARSLRLEDGREIRLAGIERNDHDGVSARSALVDIAAGRQVILHGDDDAPDRYGRQSAFVFVAGSQHSIQSELLRRGEALASIDITDKICAAALASAERTARHAKLGIWAGPAAIKNAESSGDILAAIGRFAVVEGRVVSVRQAGAITYLNFGRNWTRDFAATIPRRILPAFESAGLGPKSLENRRIRIRGVVSSRGGPRIELLRVGQVEVLGGK